LEVNFVSVSTDPIDKDPTIITHAGLKVASNVDPVRVTSVALTKLLQAVSLGSGEVPLCAVFTHVFLYEFWSFVRSGPWIELWLLKSIACQVRSSLKYF